MVTTWCGACFTGNRVGHAFEDEAGRAFCGDICHAGNYRFDVLRLEWNDCGGLDGDVFNFIFGWIRDSLDKVRRHHDAAVGKRSRGVRKLQERKGVVTLSYAYRWRVADHPRLLDAGFLPFAAGKYAGLFADKVYSGFLTKAPRHHEVMYGVDAHARGEPVVVNVGRNGD